MELEELLSGILLMALLALLMCYTKTVPRQGFGMDNKPFEPDNSLLNRNPFDDIDYVVPMYLVD